MEEKIIGYDVREMWYKEPCDFRMGSQLVKMLSIDHTLWSSIFHHGGYGDLGEKDREEKGFGMIELPSISRVGANYHLWSDLADMQNYLSPYRCAEGKPYWVIAITLRTEDLERMPRDREYWPYDPESNPDSIQSDWVLVGYDLTSRWSESMITPALLSPETEAEAVAELPRELNEYLLFPSIEKAAEFKMRWDSAAFPDEAPHLVYGIWRIEETRYRPR